MNDTDNQNTAKQHSAHANSGRLLELIWTKAVFNLRSEVHRNYLSYGWWVLEPLLHMGIYYLVFGLLLQRGDANYSTFLLATPPTIAQQADQQPAAVEGGLEPRTSARKLMHPVLPPGTPGPQRLRAVG